MYALSRKQLSIYNFITFSNQKLSIVSTYKYLGFSLDSHLTYRDHVQTLTRKLKQNLFMVKYISWLSWLYGLLLMLVHSCGLCVCCVFVIVWSWSSVVCEVFMFSC